MDISLKELLGWRQCRVLYRAGPQKKTPARFDRRGFGYLLSFYASTCFLPALDGALGTTRTTLTTRTFGATRTRAREMTNANVAVASAASSSKLCASNEGMVLKSKEKHVKHD